MENSNKEKYEAIEHIENLINEVINDYKESENAAYILAIKIVDLVGRNKLMSEFIIKQLISKHIDKRFLLLTKPIEFLRDILNVFLSHESLKETLEENEKFMEKLSVDITEILKTEGPLKAYEITERLNNKIKINKKNPKNIE